MKYGLCVDLNEMAEAAAAGFDYIEPPVNALPDMSEESFQAAVTAVEASPVKCLCFNLLFPRSLQLLDPATTDESIAAYLDIALSRVQRLGGRTAVFGSGRSRNRPEGMDFGQAFRRLIHVTRLTGEIAAKYGITIAIEPLNRAETNMINSVAEGACLAAAVDHSHVRLLADYYHVFKDNEPMDDLIRVGGVHHIHIATGEKRCCPTVDEPGFHKLFSALKAADYQGYISIEGKTDDLAAEGPVALALLKRLWAEA